MDAPATVVRGCYQEDAHSDGIWAVAWSEVDDTIISASVDDLVKMWNCDLQADGTGTLSHKCDLKGHQLGVISLSTNKTGSMVLSSSIDSNIKIWDIRGSEIRTIEAGAVECWDASFSPDAHFVAAGSQSGNVNIWSVDNGEKEATIATKSGAFVMSVAYSSDGKTLACGGIDGAISVFDVATARLVSTIQVHRSPIRSLSFAPQGSQLVAGCDDGLVAVYDVSDGSKIAALSGHQSWVLDVAYSPTQPQLASGSSDKSVKIWDLREQTCSHTFRDVHQDQVWGVAYRPSGTHLVSGSDDRSLVVYNVSA